MNPFDALGVLLRFNLFQLYTPIISSVGFSHPLTFAIIVGHNTFSLTYLLLAVGLIYPVLHRNAWLVPVGVSAAWMATSAYAMVTLRIAPVIALAATLPHGWLEFMAIAYWVNAIRNASQGDDLPELTSSPTLKDYVGALRAPRKLGSLVRMDVTASLRNTRHSLGFLWRRLKKPYAITITQIVTAALLESYITPHIVLLVSRL